MAKIIGTVLLLAACVISITGCGGNAVSQEPVSATAGWQAPTYGTPVVRYVVQHSVNGGPWVVVADDVQGLEYTLQVSYFDDHMVRVAGVDAQGRQGPYSLPSNTYNPSDFAPGMPQDVTLGESK